MRNDEFNAKAARAIVKKAAQIEELKARMRKHALEQELKRLKRKVQSLEARVRDLEIRTDF